MHDTSMYGVETPRLRLLGISRVDHNNVPLTRLGNKPLILLARLILDSRPVTREGLMAFLWPEANETRARGSLRQALHVLRECMGDGCLFADRKAVALRGDPPCDLVEFLRLVRNNDCPQAALSYGGPLLHGVTVADSTDAELWLDLERRRVGRLFETMALASLEDPRFEGQAFDRLEVARRLRDHTPRLLKSWRLLFRELRRAGAAGEILIERAALGARIETGQIDGNIRAAEILEESLDTTPDTTLDTPTDALLVPVTMP